MTSERRFRACPLCEAICGLEFRIDDGQLAAIRGDAEDPLSRGHLCPKGVAILDLEADPDRLRRPLRRHGRDWEEVSWDEAFAEAGQRLAAAQREHGADAVAAYLGNPVVHHFGHHAYLPSLLRLIRTRNVYSASSVDQWPHQLVAWAMYGHQLLVPVPDVDHTDWMLMLGANPVASNGSLMTAPGIARRLEALVRRGRLVVVDPRRTETAAIASEHVAIRPGTDAWFLRGLLEAVRACGPPRLAGYAGRLNGLDTALERAGGVTAAQAAARSGVPAGTIERLARELYGASRACVYGRMGLSTQAYGSLCQWIIQLINLYCGQLDRPGGVLPNEPAIPVTGPGTSKGHRDRWRSRVRSLPEFAGELPVAALAEEITTPGPGRVRALFTCAGNPVLSTPAGAALDAALASLDFFVAIDIYVNETTRHAHLILPPASPLTQYHYDTVFNGFAVRRVARLNAPLRSRADAERADWEIIAGVAHAYAQAAGKPWSPLPEPRTLIAAGLARGSSGLDLAALEAAPHGVDMGPLQSSLLRRLETASGMIECAPPLLVDEVARLEAEPAAPLRPGELALIGRRHVRSNNSWMHNAPRLVKGKTRHELHVHPDDLAARGLVDGERARVRSRTGAIEVEVRASDALQPGVVCLPHGFGHGRAGARLQRAHSVRGASYNDLTDPERLDAPSGNAALNGTPVTLERLEG
ncbi:MAG: molybdopterin-dependent oxidoreductase [Proteobacteria bacterium]|nr:molybdopterin-dependent oxidoreductase [Pseudomonadota bacterium]